MRILCDTNILIRHANSVDPLYQTSEDAINYLKLKQCDLSLVPQVLYEFWAVATRPRTANGLEMTIDEAIRDLHWSLQHFTLLAETAAIYPIWEELVIKTPVKGKRTHDARLVAAMYVHGVTHLLTFDHADFNSFHGITVIDPAQVTSLI